ncbi:MAG: hypothetical protein K2M43_03080 [Mycoplasmoidaceae bacterium]|nr:hypothetical protein [Mycoplasmoidaceae bacterium]
MKKLSKTIISILSIPTVAVPTVCSTTSCSSYSYTYDNLLDFFVDACDQSVNLKNRYFKDISENSSQNQYLNEFYNVFKNKPNMLVGQLLFSQLDRISKFSLVYHALSSIETSKLYGYVKDFIEYFFDDYFAQFLNSMLDTHFTISSYSVKQTKLSKVKNLYTEEYINDIPADLVSFKVSLDTSAYFE